MKKQTASVLLVLGSCVLLAAGGCAKHDMVKKDEGLSPVASAPAKAPVKTEVVKDLPVKQAPVAENTLGEVQKNAGQIERVEIRVGEDLL